jgi:D-beta-D-heptose 7-phosphate kinase/D-beta-D-heptose 1-phosphate adenosyltransferase
MREPARQLHDAINARGADTSLLVLGDLMLDRYLWGRVERLSPESPVPVVELQAESATPGGAGNVAMNLVGLGVRVVVAGVVGGDPEGSQLLHLLRQQGVDTRAVLQLDGYPTTTKTRVLTRKRQVLRLDRERSEGLDPLHSAELERRCLEALADMPAALLISDYAKGVLGSELCGSIIGEARRVGVPVLVDPKGSSFERYRGASALTPNRHELARVAGVEPHDLPGLLEAAGRARADLGLDFMLLTLGSGGMQLIDADGCRPFAARAREVYDVSGAGDTVIATLGAALALGLPRSAAVELANRAAGLTVERMGVSPIHRDELRPEPSSEGEHSAPVLPSCEAAVALVLTWRARGDRIVFTNGCFDLLHPGHVALLSRARRQGERLVVGLNTDRSVRALKGAGRPIQDQASRAAVLAALGAVDAVVLFDEDTPAALIERLLPDVLVKGADYGEQEIVGAALVKAHGGRVLRVPLEPGQGTSTILTRLQQRGFEEQGS